MIRQRLGAPLGMPDLVFDGAQYRVEVARDMPDPFWKPISSRRSGGTVAAVGPLALASRRVGGQGRADDYAVTGDGVDAEEVAISR